MSRRILVVKALRAASIQTPILILSAMAQTDDPHVSRLRLRGAGRRLSEEP